MRENVSGNKILFEKKFSVKKVYIQLAFCAMAFDQCVSVQR